MALALNTTHPLHGNLLSFICVSDGQVVDLKQPAATLTVNAAVTIGSGAYGAHFQTSNSGDSALGVSISSEHAHSLSQANARTLLVVTNGHVSSGNRRYLSGSLAKDIVGTIGINGTTGAANLRTTTGIVGTGTTDVRTGAHSLAVTRNSTTAWALVVDGNTEASGTTSYPNETAPIDLIGGAMGGRGYWSNKFVYFIWFDKVLSGAELVDLHASLGANNAFALLEASATGTPPAGTVTIGTITPSTTSASVPYTYSAGDATGYQYRLNGGTATTLGASPATITGLTASTPYSIEVRATNAEGEGAWSTAANFTTIAAGDIEPPTLTGVVTFTSVTQTSYTANWPAGLDNVSVTGYEYQIGSTAGAWTNAGNNLSAAITGRTAGTTETVYVRAYDAAGLRSTPAISGSVTLESALAAGITVTEPLKNNTGTVLASQSGIRVAVLQAADLVSVYETSGLTTNASGILATISDAAITAGQQYHVAIKLADGGGGITGPITAS